MRVGHASSSIAQDGDPRQAEALPTALGLHLGLTGLPAGEARLPVLEVPARSS